MAGAKKKARTCRGCGAPEKVDSLGYSNMAQFVDYCATCIARAKREVRGGR